MSGLNRSSSRRRHGLKLLGIDRCRRMYEHFAGSAQLEPMTSRIPNVRQANARLQLESAPVTEKRQPVFRLPRE